MKTLLRLLLVFAAGWGWFLLLAFVDKHTHTQKVIGGLPEWLGIVAALGLSFGPWLLGYLVVLLRAWTPKTPRSIIRRIACFILAVVLATGSWVGGTSLFKTFGYSPGSRTPGQGDFSEEDVQTFITVGRPFDEITNRFGQPRLIRTNGQFLIWHFRSGLPDTHPTKTIEIAGEKGYVFAGFNLWTTNGSAAKWRASDWEKSGK